MSFFAGRKVLYSWDKGDVKSDPPSFIAGFEIFM